jgi:methylated-DNA-[protein]-cysteine S-methyltransferase
LDEMTVFGSVIGKIVIFASEAGITHLVFAGDKEEIVWQDRKISNKHLANCKKQLGEYFAGRRTSFDIPIDLKGTPFQISVWRTLLLIPYGSTWSYGKVASQIGRPKASRAVGGANHSNPISIIVPCHRVIGENGKLTGYGGGIWRKKWLLEHEENANLRR